MIQPKNIYLFENQIYLFNFTAACPEFGSMELMEKAYHVSYETGLYSSQHYYCEFSS